MPNVNAVGWPTKLQQIPSCLGSYWLATFIPTATILLCRCPMAYLDLWGHLPTLFLSFTFGFNVLIAWWRSAFTSPGYAPPGPTTTAAQAGLAGPLRLGLGEPEGTAAVAADAAPYSPLSLSGGGGGVAGGVDAMLSTACPRSSAMAVTAQSLAGAVGLAADSITASAIQKPSPVLLGAPHSHAAPGSAGNLHPGGSAPPGNVASAYPCSSSPADASPPSNSYVAPAAVVSPIDDVVPRVILPSDLHELPDASRALRALGITMSGTISPATYEARIRNSQFSNGKLEAILGFTDLFADVESGNLSGDTNGEKAELNPCVKCGIPDRPPRAHHCTHCGKCTLRMDHHCPWINNCVGVGNHRYFIIMCGWGMLGSFVSMVYMWFAPHNGQYYRLAHLALGALLLFMTSSLFCQHYAMSIFNITTIEQRARGYLGLTYRTAHAFDLGPRANQTYLLGPNLWTRIFPWISYSPIAGGMRYGINEPLCPPFTPLWLIGGGTLSVENYRELQKRYGRGPHGTPNWSEGDSAPRSCCGADRHGHGPSVQPPVEDLDLESGLRGGWQQGGAGKRTTRHEGEQ